MSESPFFPCTLTFYIREVLNGVDVDGVGEILPICFFCFSLLLVFYFVCFSSLVFSFFAFVSASWDKFKTTAIYWKMGNFTPTPSAPNPTHNYPIDLSDPTFTFVRSRANASLISSSFTVFAATRSLALCIHTFTFVRSQTNASLISSSFRERKISPKLFCCIKFFQIRDVPTQIPGHPGHSVSKTTEKATCIKFLSGISRRLGP